jgi:hypothetical protein
VPTMPQQAPLPPAPTPPPAGPAPAPVPPVSIPSDPPPSVAAMSAAPPQHPFPLTRIGGGGVVNVPAHETDIRGPTFKDAQQKRNEMMAGAISAVSERNERTAAQDYAIALEQERRANIQADAAAYSQAERQQEMELRQADFDATVKSMAQQASDPKHFYTEPNAFAKLSALASSVLAGFVQGKTGRGGNPGLDLVQNWMNREARAQEMSFQAGQAVMGARQTAFAMAMQKYNNVDAARAATRGALADAASAVMAQQAALWKTADAQNRATMAITALQDEKMQQIAQGIMFTPQHQVAQGPVFVDPETGITYNEAQAREVAKEHRGQGFKREEIGLNTAGDILKEGAKAQASAQKDIRAEQVQLPNGDVVRARSPADATELSKLATSVNQAQSLISEAKRIREGTSWRIPGTEDRRRLESIQGELTLATKDRGGLGALSGPDMDLVNSIVGDLTSQAPNAGVKLDAFMGATNNALRARVKTIPDAPGTAKGQMPTSFTPHGKK